VRRAQAEARVLAEIQIKKLDPKWWLSRMYRDRPDEPAWSNPTRTELPVDEDQPLTIMAIKRYLSSRLDQGEQSQQAAIDTGPCGA
jgi:hypothetical protein